MTDLACRPGDTATIPDKTAAAALLTCPQELLAEIFSYGCAGPDDIGDPDEIMRLNELRCRSSFIVAAVCQRWRSVSLGHPTLWHYVGVPTIVNFGEEAIARLLDYIQLVLARSQQVPVDVVFNFIDGDRQEHVLFEPFFELLLQHITRWRRFAAVVSGLDAIQRVLELLSGETPQLWSVQLSYQDSPSHHSRRVYFRPAQQLIKIPSSFLPHVPLMKNLSAYNLPELWEHWHSRAHRTLIVFEIGQLVAPSNTWDLLTQHTALALLLLSCHTVDASTLQSPPPQPVTMPRLECIWLVQDAYKIFAMNPNALRLPRLSELTLESPQLFTLCPWFASLRESLTTLDLRDIVTFSTADLEAIQDLPHLESLQLCSVGQIPHAMLQQLIAEEFIPPSQSISTTEVKTDQVGRKQTGGCPKAMWPRLTTLHIVNVWFDETGGSMFTQMVKMRSKEGPQNAAHLPKWLKMQVRMFLVRGLSEEQLKELEEIGVEKLS